MASVAVTGATSFVGVHMCAELLNKGYTVHACTRDLSNESKVGPLKALGGNLKLFSADVNVREQLEAAFAGCTAVVHLAVPHPQHGGKPVLGADEITELKSTAVKGATETFHAAKAAGVKKVVYTSSLAAVESGNSGALDETCWSSEALYGAEENASSNHFQYVAAKTLSEKEAWKAAEATGVAITVICPGNLIIGEVLSNHLNGTMQHVADICSGKNTLAHHADIAPVNVKDVCAAHVAAVENEASNGKRYLCAPHLVTSPALIAQIKALCEKAAVPPTEAPEKIIVGTWGQCRTTVNKLGELGVNAMPLEDTLKTAVGSLVARNYITA